MFTHEQKVKKIAEQLKERKSTSPVSLRKKAVSHRVPNPDDKRFSDEKIDISFLNEIIHIDPEKQICIAEPGVTFVDLVKATMKHNLVPIIVPELKTITIGGAVAGCSLESMSFKHGGFHDTCLEYEVITAHNGFDGINSAQEESPDCIITDIMMPVMNGIRFFNNLKKNDKVAHIPVIAVTSFIKKMNTKSLMNIGFSDVISKPLKLNTVINKVQKVMEKTSDHAS